MRKTAWMLAVLIGTVATPTAAADGEGLTLSPDQAPWPRWQGRIALGSSGASGHADADSSNTRLSNATVMGDYYFSPSFAGPTVAGGFRATSGLIVGPRSQFATGQSNPVTGNAFSIGSRMLGSSALPAANEPAADVATLPYLGVGYTGLSTRSGWSFSADLGLVSQSPGNAVKLGHTFSGGQGLDDLAREMRLAPLLQLGVSYAF